MTSSLSLGTSESSTDDASASAGPKRGSSSTSASASATRSDHKRSISPPPPRQVKPPAKRAARKAKARKTKRRRITRGLQTKRARTPKAKKRKQPPRRSRPSSSASVSSLRSRSASVSASSSTRRRKRSPRRHHHRLLRLQRRPSLARASEARLQAAERRASSSALASSENEASSSASSVDSTASITTRAPSTRPAVSSRLAPKKRRLNPVEVKTQQEADQIAEQSLEGDPSFEALVNAPSSASASVAVPATSQPTSAPAQTEASPEAPDTQEPPMHIAPTISPTTPTQAAPARKNSKRKSSKRKSSKRKSRQSHHTPRASTSSRRASAAIVAAPASSASPVDVLAPTKARMGEMSAKDLLKALKRALKARKPAAVDLYVCLHETHANDVDLERHVTPQQARKLVLLALYAVQNGPTRLVTILRSLASREHSPVQIDALYTKDRSQESAYESSSKRRRGIFGLSRKKTLGQRRTLPYLIAGNPQLSTKERREWLDVVLDDPEVGPHFDLNRDVDSAGGNLLLRSYTKLHITDPKWYTQLIEKRYVAVNTHGPNNETLKGYLQSAKKKGLKTPLGPHEIDEVLECLVEHGGKTVGELRV